MVFHFRASSWRRVRSGCKGYRHNQILLHSHSTSERVGLVGPTCILRRRPLPFLLAAWKSIIAFKNYSIAIVWIQGLMSSMHVPCDLVISLALTHTAGLLSPSPWILSFLLRLGFVQRSRQDSAPSCLDEELCVESAVCNRAHQEGAKNLLSIFAFVYAALRSTSVIFGIFIIVHCF